MVNQHETNSSCGCYERSFSEVAIAMTEKNSFHTYCVICGKVGWTKKKTLKLCSRCKSVAYCSQECQKADYSYHKEMCLSIASLKPAVREEAKVLYRKLGGDSRDSTSTILDLWPSDEDDQIYNYAHSEDASRYIVPRGALMHQLEYECIMRVNLGGKINEIGLTTALEHKFDLFALFHASDFMLNRDGVAGNLIGLRRYQQAYDFLKFWLTISFSDVNVESGPNPPFLIMKGEDMFETIPVLKISRDCIVDARQVMAMALLKLSLFAEIRAVQLFTQKFGLHDDIVSVVAGFLNGDVAGNWNEIDTSILLFQARQLLSCVHAKQKDLLTTIATLAPWIKPKDMSEHSYIITWFKHNKVAMNFFKNFVRDIDASLVPVDELMGSD